jgi:hypothetical protein
LVSRLKVKEIKETQYRALVLLLWRYFMKHIRQLRKKMAWINSVRPDIYDMDSVCMGCKAKIRVAIVVTLLFWLKI